MPRYRCAVPRSASGLRADSGSSKDAITSTTARDAGLQAATRLSQKIFSYDWKTFDQDAASSEKVLGASFRKEYASTIAKTRATAVANQVKQTAQASATSIVSASDQKVVALVFMISPVGLKVAVAALSRVGAIATGHSHTFFEEF